MLQIYSEIGKLIHTPFSSYFCGIIQNTFYYKEITYFDQMRLAPLLQHVIFWRVVVKDGKVVETPKPLRIYLPSGASPLNSKG